MRHTHFQVKNFKAVKNAEIDLSNEGLVLFLGVNESGKTTLLRAIEAFDYNNDPEMLELKNIFLARIRNKKEINSTATITASLSLEKDDYQKILENTEITEEKIKSFNSVESIKISRHFEYEKAKFKKEWYQLEINEKELFTEDEQEIGTKICKSIINLCPAIQYFEDFKDQIPNYISLTPGQEYFDPDWAKTIEGLFYHTNSSITAKNFQELDDADARETTLNKVNKSLNKQFTNRWNKKLKGAKSIHKIDLVYDSDKKLFTFKIVGADSVTVFAVEERSKGALWYLTFLLKTEFRKKKLRAESGTTLYLIDEPASNLHSTAQANMVDDFRTLATDSNVVYTTHSQYLIDRENLSNVYIVEHSRSGVIKLLKFGEYLKGKKVNTSYYQPIIDALEIQPYSLDFSWGEVLIVEGVYDYCGFKVMFFDVMKKPKDFVIMPATGAGSMGTLISLHIGWGAKQSILLDDDNEGNENKLRYVEKFPTLENQIHTYDFVASNKNTGFERLFSEEERRDIIKIAGFNSDEMTKKLFQQALANISQSPNLIRKMKKIVGEETIRRFEKIFNIVAKDLKLSNKDRKD